VAEQYLDRNRPWHNKSRRFPVQLGWPVHHCRNSGYFNQDNLYLGIKVRSRVQKLISRNLHAYPGPMHLNLAHPLEGGVATQSATGFMPQEERLSTFYISFTCSRSNYSAAGPCGRLTIVPMESKALRFWGRHHSISLGAAEPDIQSKRRAR